MYNTRNYNIQLLSIIYIGILSLKYDTLEYIIFWLIALLSAGNAKRLSNYDTITLFARRFLYIIPLSIPLLYYKGVDDFYNIQIHYFILSFAAGITMYLFINRSMLRYSYIFLSESVLNEKTDRNYSDLISSIMMIFGSCIFEEYFFRFIIIERLNIPLITSLFTSTTLFILWHISQNWSYKFKVSDIINQVMLSVISAFFIVKTGNIMYSIILHIFTNLFPLIKEMKILFYKKKKGKLQHGQSK